MYLDVAVQIVNNWYHNFPQQHTLIVTHSNQALNQIFEKIIKLDVDERHLLRLGHGERELDTDSDFSKLGRVDWMLNLRLEMLKQVSSFYFFFVNPCKGSRSCKILECHHRRGIHL